MAQIALSILLVTGAALFIRSLRAAQAVDLGFTTENRLLVSLNLQDHGYDNEATGRFVENVIEKVGAVPGVESATTMTFAPFRGSWRSSFEVPGVAPPGRADPLVPVLSIFAGDEHLPPVVPTAGQEGTCNQPVKSRRSRQRGRNSGVARRVPWKETDEPNRTRQGGP